MYPNVTYQQRRTIQVEDDRRFEDSVYEKLRDYMRRDDRSSPVIELAAPEEIYKAFESSATSLRIGKESVDEDRLLKSVDLLLKYSARTSHPLFLNQLYSRADPVGIASDWISTATNTNVHTYEVAPVYTLIERELIRKIADVIGGRFVESETDGLFVPGGSISNLYVEFLIISLKYNEYHSLTSLHTPDHTNIFCITLLYRRILRNT